jgi:hypothetical protein
MSGEYGGRYISLAPAVEHISSTRYNDEKRHCQWQQQTLVQVISHDAGGAAQ